MTKTKILKEFFKKFFGIDAHGNSVTKVIDDVVQNNDSLGMSSAGGVMRLNIVDMEDLGDETYRFTVDKTYQEIKNFDGISFIESLGYVFYVIGIDVQDHGDYIEYGIIIDDYQHYHCIGVTGSPDGYPVFEITVGDNK